MLKTSKLLGGWHQSAPQHQVDNRFTRPNYPSTVTGGGNSSVNVTPKDAAMSTSLDSGVAGLRDTPVHITTNNTPSNSQHTPVTPTNSNMPAPKQSSPAEEQQQQHQNQIEVPKFIVDQTTRTTYMKGRFLGKVGSIYIIFLLFI